MRARTLFSIITLVTATSSSWAGQTHIVDCTGAGDFTSVQTAINAAVNGDTIVIRPNTCTPSLAYVENVNLMGKQLRLQSTDPSDPAVVASTIIDCGTTASGTITVDVPAMPTNSPPVELAGFTIRKGFYSLKIGDASVSLSSMAFGPAGRLQAFGGGGSRTIAISSSSFRQMSEVRVTDFILTVNDSSFVENNTGLDLSSTSVRIQDSRFERNAGLAGLEIDLTPACLVERCVFLDNSGSLAGGIAFHTPSGIPPNPLLVRDCVFAGNVGSFGGAMKCVGNGIMVDHCTFTGNRSIGGNASIYIQGATDLIVKNSILWNNKSSSPNYSDIWPSNGTNVSYCNIQFGSAASTPGSISADPMFVYPGVWNATFTGGDFRLQPGSPCINAADPAFHPGLGETDLDGAPRVIGCRSDMGTYEKTSAVPYPGDLNGDGMTTIADMPLFIQAVLNGDSTNCATDCNSDGVVNGLDIQFFVHVFGFAGVPVQPSVLIQIEQVFGSLPSAQAIQLRMRADGQDLQNCVIRAYPKTVGGGEIYVIATFPAPVANTSAGSRVLITSPGFANFTTPTVVPDVVMTNQIPTNYLFNGGSLTLEDNAGTVYWRLSWGGTGYTGPTIGSTLNDADGDFGKLTTMRLTPLASLQAMRFLGAAADLSTTNQTDYGLTFGAAVFTNNAGNTFMVVDPGHPPTGDFDAIGSTNGRDIRYFVNCVLTGSSGGAPCHYGDFDLSGTVDTADVAPFISRLLGV